MLKNLIYVMLLLFFINCKHEKQYKCAYVHIYNNNTGEELDLDLFVEINESFSQTTFIELSLPNGERINDSKIFRNLLSFIPLNWPQITPKFP